MITVIIYQDDDDPGVWSKLHNNKPERPISVSTDPDVVRPEVFQL